MDRQTAADVQWLGGVSISSHLQIIDLDFSVLCGVNMYKGKRVVGSIEISVSGKDEIVIVRISIQRFPKF